MNLAQKIALVVGTEGDGLSAAALARCDTQVRIPMAAEMDSINVATACAIALHHLRQLHGAMDSGGAASPAVPEDTTAAAHGASPE